VVIVSRMLEAVKGSRKSTLCTNSLQVTQILAGFPQGSTFL
jgi:hypothetical protein